MNSSQGNTLTDCLAELKGDFANVFSALSEDRELCVVETKRLLRDRVEQAKMIEAVVLTAAF
jgi:hypothetical protein